jgi:hypothetical protein
MAAVVAARGGRADEGAGVVRAGDRPAVEDLHQRFRLGSPRHHGASASSCASSLTISRSVRPTTIPVLAPTFRQALGALRVPPPPAPRPR